MKLRVFYNSSGVIQSVMQMNPKARIVPVSALYSYVDVDMRKTGASSLGEVQACFRVDAHGGLHRHSELKSVAIQGKAARGK